MPSNKVSSGRGVLLRPMKELCPGERTCFPLEPWPHLIVQAQSGVEFDPVSITKGMAVGINVSGYLVPANNGTGFNQTYTALDIGVTLLVAGTFVTASDVGATVGIPGNIVIGMAPYDFIKNLSQAYIAYSPQYDSRQVLLSYVIEIPMVSGVNSDVSFGDFLRPITDGTGRLVKWAYTGAGNHDDPRQIVGKALFVESPLVASAALINQATVPGLGLPGTATGGYESHLVTALNADGTVTTAAGRIILKVNI